MQMDCYVVTEDIQEADAVFETVFGADKAEQRVYIDFNFQS
jgi:hypothetical protein